ncbi:MAG: methyltransferase [Chitinophagaceae bacterium]|nr:methyltransferase [Chitinophagaceae bacterium]
MQQEHCAMKVTTDACLFGAWAASIINNEKLIITKGLDIGTGTGLLSLMLAQKSSAPIHAVEIDAAAATQATENFASSPWKERLHVHQTSIQQFNHPTNLHFNFIITNPPFFDNDLKSENEKRNLALHSSSLSLKELLQAIKANLTNDGCFAILLPYHRTNYFMELAIENGFYLQEKVLVKQTEKHDYFRSMLLFSYQQTSTIETEIIIKQNNQYSPAFIHLLKDYYLQF